MNKLLQVHLLEAAATAAGLGGVGHGCYSPLAAAAATQPPSSALAVPPSP
ncbi:unnamed protein product [Ectocarpus sp. CCAP 1310/34]|nr:unnamed protein product [Ectocarpus sp. CCAP 1310/34]